LFGQLRIGEDFQDGIGGTLKLLEILNDLLSFLDELGRNLLLEIVTQGFFHRR
jgi:hypothetical protein